MRRLAVLLALVLPPALGAQVRCTRIVRGRATDAGSALPVGFARVRSRCGGAVAAPDGRFEVYAEPGDTLVVGRVGYRVARVVAPDEATLDVRLVPVVARLDAVAVRGGAASAGRLVASRDVDAMRAAGATTVADAVAQLPYVAARGARGDVALSMRGSRAEQVAVTLDGLPLADPATGRADIADIPLAALGGASVAPGADPIALGSGATGGVLALTSAARPMLALGAGSFGRAMTEANATTHVGAARIGVGGAWGYARNDFPFRNTFAATGADSVERRTNADERRAAAFASVQHPGAQLLVLASEAEQGMAGEMNVRLYDAARSRRRRLVARAAASPGGWALGGGIRAFGLDYDDPRQPGAATRAGAVSVDADAARGAGPFALRAGVGLDRATGTGLDAQRRARAFGSAVVERRGAGLLARAGARVDALEGAHAQPSFSAALERPARLAPFVRVSQAFRAPTLYDLYFAAPQRIVARPLRPERVALDGESGLRLQVGALSLAGSGFVRRTRDAIVWFPGSVGWSPQNVARERVVGAEGSVLVTTAHADVQGWIGRYDTALRTGRLVLPTPYVPYLAGGGTATLRAGAASLAATLRATDRRPFAVAPATRETELPGVALVNVHVAWRVTAFRFAALLTAGADNVGDARWESVRGFPTPGRSWSAGLLITP